ncbi:MAG: hypothetical protein M3Z01_09865 [Thermoproteota archaeon]|nr:hypothetical protein [Thermoproteota archaeon]
MFYSIDTDTKIGFSYTMKKIWIFGYNDTGAIILLSVLLYHIGVYYSIKNENDNPRIIKYAIGS